MLHEQDICLDHAPSLADEMVLRPPNLRRYFEANAVQTPLLN